MKIRRHWRQAVVVLVKEFVDSCRDRRALASVLLTVLIGPVITGFMMNRIADRQRAAEEVRIPIAGAQNAPALVEWLRQQSGVEVAPAPAAPEQAVKNQDEYVVAIIPPDFAERFRASKPATIKLVADSARADTFPQVDRVRRLFEQYNAQIGSLRLVGRGVSPAVATPVVVQEVEVSTTQQRAARLLAVIPLMILLAAFTGAMQIATDATAGERERGLAGGAADQPGAAQRARGRQDDGRGVDRHDRRDPDRGDLRRAAAIHPAAGDGDAVPVRRAALCRDDCGGAADVPGDGGDAVVRRDDGALLQGGAELHGHPDPGADAGGRARHPLSDRQPAVDVRGADAGAVRAADATCWGDGRRARWRSSARR